MTIEVERRMKYGGTNVTDKYRPLEVKYVRAQADAYTSLISYRRELMIAAHILPQTLYLRTNWRAAVADEAGHLPPIVVISTDRSQWIKTGIEASEAQMTVSPYTGEHDLNALTDFADRKQAPPLYAPLRSGTNRNIYMVVHNHEFGTYNYALRGTGIRVVGWYFDVPEGSPIKQLVGFGASRFAAIEFCKQLRTQAGNPWNYAWLMDDNVVGFTAFPGYAFFETAIAAAPGTLCAGFSGGTNAEDHAATVKWARAEVSRPVPAPTLEPGKGVIQQAALWNIAEFTTRRLNFGPAFVASGEDVSLTAYLDRAKLPYLYYGLKVWKEAATYSDGSDGSKLVKTAREGITKWFVDAEAATVAGRTAPPPVTVHRKDGTNETLSAFITNWLTTAPPTHLTDAGTLAVQQKAMCHGVEQIVCESAGKKYNLLDLTALAANLRINGDNEQTVVRRSFSE